VPIVVACLAVALGVYAPTLGYDFVWDDLIILDGKIRFYEGVRDVLLEPADLAGLRVYRPVTFGSYWLDHLAWGRDALGFHLANVVLHALNAALVAALALALGCGPAASLAGGLLFAVHPVHQEAVAWIASRADLLVTTFGVATVLLALTDRTRPRPWLVGAIAVTSFAAAGSKEVGVTLPVLLVLVDRLAPAPAAWHGTWRRAGAAAAGVGAYLWLRPADRAVGLDLQTLDAAGLGRLVSALGFYVEQTFAPWGVTAFMPAPPGGVIAVVAALAAVAGSGLLAIRGERAGTLRRLGLAWCALTLAPPLLVAVAEMLQTKVAERYLYLPSVGMVLLVAGELAARAGWLRRRPVQAGAAAVLALLAAVTVVRAAVWRDEITLWSAVVGVEPRYALPFANLGLALKAAGRLDKADAALTAALAKKGDAENERYTLINLGHLRLAQRRSEAAIPLFERANAIGPHASALHGLGIALRWRARTLAAGGDATAAARTLAQARQTLETALAINARHSRAHFVLAGVLYDLGRYDEAVAHYRAVVAIEPESEAGKTAAAAIVEVTRE